MKYEDGQLLFSATDLANHLGCTHLTELDRRVAEGLIQRDYRQDPMLDLLIELGEIHERAYLDSLRAEGKTVVEIATRDWQAAAEQTLQAMQQGTDVIAQAALVRLPWRGRADILLKVSEASNLGAWSYQVADTKLSHTTTARAVLQLCLYTDILSTLQNKQPTSMHIVQPGQPFHVDTLRVADFMAYYRMARVQFQSQLNVGPNPASSPEPTAQCDVCSWWLHCNEIWRRDDHLTFVAGISKSQIAELRSQGRPTLESFAASPIPLAVPPRRGSPDSYAKLHRQAQIQVAGRTTGKPHYEFTDLEDDRGFLRLPLPDPGDIFFDIEGSPTTLRDSLEYLFGYVTLLEGRAEYTGLWGLSSHDEKQQFERFIDFVMRRWQQHPGLHIYHFAPYEPTALKRLATHYATREDELDRLLRADRFVDLYAVVRQGIRASVESYSIKQLEQFYGYQRVVPLEGASQALRTVERLIQLDLCAEIPDQHRETVQKYNQDDCLSTYALREWLETLRSQLESQHGPLPRPPVTSGDPSDDVKDQADQTKEVFERLTADITDTPVGEEQQARWLLAHMLDYFRREGKCVWWEFFRLHELEHDELLRERKAVSGLIFERQVPGRLGERTPTHRYRFVPQEVTLDEGEELVEVAGESIGTMAAINLVNGTLDIKKRGDAVGIHPSAVFGFTLIRPTPMPESLLEFGRQLLRGDQQSARYDLLARRPPRLKTLSLPLAGNTKETAIQLAFDLDHSVLPIQGPPGAGKTFVGSHMIAALARSGKRVGVTAVSHKVILNLLQEVLSQANGTVRVAHQMSDPGDDFPDQVVHLADKDESSQALREGYVVGGTAWLWSNSAMEGELDYLFIDEAGQMSLAMALAAGRAAKNIVLLGDPQQLEQPQQGSHPDGAGVAALTHLLDGADTMPSDKGLFLPSTFRLHPSICQFTSDQYYDGRLDSQLGLECQDVLGTSLYCGNGLRFVPVLHESNQNRSDEEVGAIVRIVAEITDGSHQWLNQKGIHAAISLAEVLVIAPYNAQVSALKAALPAGARVGTVDKFQGQEAPIVIYSMTSSSASDAPRGMEFLFSRNRMNVATSRARCLVLLVGSPRLFEPECATPRQMRLANGFCRYLELAHPVSVNVSATNGDKRKRG